MLAFIGLQKSEVEETIKSETDMVTACKHVAQWHGRGRLFFAALPLEGPNGIIAVLNLHDHEKSVAGLHDIEVDNQIKCLQTFDYPS